MQVSWHTARKRLATLWLVGAGLVFFVLLLQTLLGRYGAEAGRAWTWFLPTIMPTLSLVVGVLAMDVLGRGARIETVDRFFFRLSFMLSLAYLVVVALTVLAQPFAEASAFELMEQSNLWLGPFQGLVSAALGAFFIQREKP